MRVYISGPITGHADCNAPAFAAAADWAAAQGWTSVNPLGIRPDHDGDCPDGPKFLTVDGSAEHAYGCFMRADLVVLLSCDAILLLPGWERSRGANAELAVAEICGMPVHHFDAQPVVA